MIFKYLFLFKKFGNFLFYYISFKVWNRLETYSCTKQEEISDKSDTFNGF